MQGTAFEELFGALTELQLDSTELARLRDWLTHLHLPGACLGLIAHAAGTPPCPHCQCSRVHRCGEASGLQRWRCLACRHSYNALTGTPLARLRKRELWLPFLTCLLESETVRKAAEQIGVNPSTSFRWRHRFAPGAACEPPSLLSGMVEADETYLLESQKGSRCLDRPPRRRGGVTKRRSINRDHDCLLVARDRSKQTLDFHTGRGPVSSTQLERSLGPALAPDALLISDSARAYVGFAARAGIRHEAINVRAGERARGAIHLNSVNGWHSRFKTWLRRFNGVASRYLHHYSGWQRILDDARLTTPADLLCAIVRCAR